MRSAAHVGSHPIHPMIVPFPVAFLFAATVADAVGLLLDRPAWWQAGAVLAAAGIVAGVVAAVPGAIDWFQVVPPGSSAKRRATTHLLVNGTALACFALAFVLRGGFGSAPANASIALEVGGLVLLSLGGWLGGTLVYRNQIGVDHRYTGAGKAGDLVVDPSADGMLRFAVPEGMEPGHMRLVRVGERRLVLARTPDGWAAFDDRCTHRGGSLADGVLIAECVQCPWHGSQFDVRSGAVVAGPAQRPIEVHVVEQRGTWLLLAAAAPDTTRLRQHPPEGARPMPPM